MTRTLRIFFAGALLGSGPPPAAANSGVPPAVATAKPVVAPAVKVAPANRLLMAGDGRSLWVVVVHPRKHVFELLIRRSQQSGRSPPRWRRVAQGLFVGSPICLAARPADHRSPYDPAAYIIFGDGAGWIYGVHSQSTLPPLPPGITPISTAAGGGKFFVLGYGSYAPAPAAGVTRRRRIAPPAWHLLSWEEGGWRVSSAPPLGAAPRMDQPQRWPILMDSPGGLWLWRPAGSDDRQVLVETAKAGSFAPSWRGPVRVALPSPADSLLPVCVQGRVCLLWLNVAAPERMRMGGAQVHAVRGIKLVRPWSLAAPSGWGGRNGAFENVAAAGADGAIHIVLRNPDNKLLQTTLSLNGKVLHRTAPLAVAPRRRRIPGNYEEIMIVGLVFLLAFSLWRRKKSSGSRERLNKSVVVRMYRQVLAAVIDRGMAVAGAVIFGIDSQRRRRGGLPARTLPAAPSGKSTVP